MGLVDTVFDAAIGWMVQSILGSFFTEEQRQEDVAMLQQPEMKKSTQMVLAATAAEGRMMIDNRLLSELLKELFHGTQDVMNKLNYYQLHQLIEYCISAASINPEESGVSSPYTPSFFQRVSSSMNQITNWAIHGRKRKREEEPTHNIMLPIEIRNGISERINGIVNRLRIRGKSVQEVLQPEISRHNMASELIVYGRNNQMVWIVERLIEGKSSDLGVLPLVGVGGVGKTTLAMVVYHCPTIVDHFDLRMWVCVSDNFNEQRLTREILEVVGWDRQGCENIISFDALQEMLLQKIRHRRFLLVLDDIREDGDRRRWEKLLAPLKCNEANGCMILATTRSTSVARMIGTMSLDDIWEVEVNGLHEKDLWMIFKACAFCGNENLERDPVLKFIGMLVAQELKGNPLAARSVGALLNRSVSFEHWRLVLDNLRSFLEQTLHMVRKQRLTTSIPIELKVYGRDAQKDIIIEKLVKGSCSELGVLPLVGVGGVGKTTLSRFVYHDQRIKDHFDLRMWVCVSDNFNEQRLTREMLEHVCRDRQSYENIISFDVLQKILQGEIRRKRFLLVLDDMWEDRDRSGWEKLLAPLKCNEANGCMILATTRRTSVARMIGTMSKVEVNGLDETEFWFLFKACAFFGNENLERDPVLQSIGKQIAKELKGNPLAARSVSALLNKNVSFEHWREVQYKWKSLLEQDNDNILSILKFSYDYLPVHLQQCFSYCSLFPKDHKFTRRELVYAWISQNFVKCECHTERLEETGKKYLDDLVDCGFFKEVGSCYVMHDLMHDLAEDGFGRDPVRKMAMEANKNKEALQWHDNFFPYNADLLTPYNDPVRKMAMEANKNKEALQWQDNFFPYYADLLTPYNGRYAQSTHRMYHYANKAIQPSQPITSYSPPLQVREVQLVNKSRFNGPPRQVPQIPEEISEALHRNGQPSSSTPGVSDAKQAKKQNANPIVDDFHERYLSLKMEEIDRIVSIKEKKLEDPYCINKCIQTLENLQGLPMGDVLEAADIFTNNKANREAFLSFSSDELRLGWLVRQIHHIKMNLK